MTNPNVPLSTDQIREALGAAESIPTAEIAVKRPRIAEALGFASIVLPQLGAELQADSSEEDA